MKKLIIILLFSVGIQAQVKTPDFIQKTVISGIIEIDGHESKSYLIFEANLKGIRIYDRDTNEEYQLRKCNKDKCNIIHLETKNTAFLTSGHWGIINTTTSKTEL